MDPKLAKSKAMHLLKENEDLLKDVIEKEREKIERTRIEAESEFDLLKRYYLNEGIKEGFRILMQKLNEAASKDI